MKTDEFCQQVTDRILAEIEKGTAPWVKPWASSQIQEPNNPLTGKKYQGMNRFWLSMIDVWGTGQFATFNQIRDAGGMVRKGEKGTHVLRPIELKQEFKEATTGEKGEESRVLFTPYVVFNCSQADGLDHLKPPPVDIKPVERRPDIEAMIAMTGAAIRPHPSHCFYRPSTDDIHLVEAGAFESIDHAYATTFHELGHWTGHESRLKRDLTGTFKTHAYAAEELIAELASAFTCHHFGIDGLDRHAGAYLVSWTKLFTDDKKATLKAAGAAQRAFRHLVPEVTS